MFARFMPREERFFDLFKDIAEQTSIAAHEFKAMLGDLEHAESRAHTIKELEHRADSITHRTVELLHKTFITPLDREDIHTLISRMDDIMDFIEAASQRVFLYGITEAPPEALALTDICIQATDLIKKAVGDLDNLKNPEQIIRACVEINRLENEADYILRAGMAKLFREEEDVRKLIKLKEIFELLETVTDRCEDVANTIEGIVLEYA
jgi:predicted phosphate transport protein (TIGR00153 family)